MMGVAPLSFYLPCAIALTLTNNPSSTVATWVPTPYTSPR